jgi:hypothetical protein
MALNGTGYDVKQRWIEYREEWWKRSPMAFWVHLPVDRKRWIDAAELDPPAPAVVPGQGYPVYSVEYDGFVFQFSSLDELRVCIDVLGQRNLPDVRMEWHKRSGPGSHWLNKLPGHVLAWAYREGAVRYLRESLDAFAQDRIAT